MLAGVRTPDGRTVTFGYDALSRRVSKRTGDTVHRFGWDDCNVVLHEWDTDRSPETEARHGRDRARGIRPEWRSRPTSLHGCMTEHRSRLWQVTDGERYPMVHDYLGTPTQAYDSKERTCLGDAAGRVRQGGGMPWGPDARAVQVSGTV
ncbi:hypothetical protein NXW62_14360 [Bacteroides fragilis]|nr:hypothetical protein [Bacteroides fragilis]